MPENKKKNVWLLSSLGCAIAGTGCGIPFIPGIRGSRQPGIHYPRFVLGSNDSGQELHIPTQDFTRNKGQTVSIPFSKANMKWGFRTLKEQEALISSCKNNNQFYVGTHKWGSEYRLHNGKKFFLKRDNCCCNGESTDNNEKVKPITLNPTFKQVSNGTGGTGNGTTESTVSKLILLLSTCTFTFSKENNQANSDKWNLKMDCKGYTDTNNGSGSGAGGACEQKNVSITLDSSHYKPRYVKTTTNSTQK